MLTLQVKLDARNLRRLGVLGTLSRIGAAQALTFTAERAVPAWRAANRLAFHMRRDWIDKGVRVRMATPSNMVAQVGSIDRYMARHVVGAGEEKVASAGRKLFVPLLPAAQQGTHSQIRRGLRAADRTSRKTFELVTGSGKTLIVRRRGRSRDDLQFLGVLQSRVSIPQRLPAVGVVEAAVDANFGPVYERLLLKIIERG
jgi:hypothetical protein